MCFRVQIIVFVFFIVSEVSFAQNFYRSVADIDSFTYVTMNDKILILKRDQSNELQYVNSIPFVMTHRQDKFNTEVIINDRLLVSSKDSVVLFSISDRENPVELDRIGIPRIFSINKFGPYCLVVQNTTTHVVGIENNSLIIKTSISLGQTKYNPYFPEWNLFSFSYPYALSWITHKYDIENNQFNVIDSINVCQNCGWYGILANPEDTTFIYCAIGCCLGSGSIDWYSYQIGVGPNDPYLCIYDTGSPLLPVEGYSIKKIYGCALATGGPKWFYSDNICQKFSFPVSVDPINYPIAIDSLMYRIGSQGFYYQYQINNNNLVFRQFQLPVSVENENNSLPLEMELEQNYPNPFNPETKIKYTLNKSSIVKLNVYDVLGNRISTILNEFKNAGTYETTFDGSDLPSGMYFYNLISENNSITKKMMLIK